MNVFDKLCAVLACVLAVALLILGVIGLFTGRSANFTLPPILGVLPALIGWGIIRSVQVAWRQSGPSPLTRQGAEGAPPPVPSEADGPGAC